MTTTPPTLAVQNSILIVDDEPAQRQLLSAILEHDYLVTRAAGAEEAMQLLKRREFDLIVTDERMPGTGGLDLIRWVNAELPETPIIVLTAYGSIQTAVEAIKLGALDYLTKPLESPDELRRVVRNAIQQRVLRNQHLVHRAESESQFPTEIVAESAKMKQVLRLAGQVAPQPSTVLLTGESGTGKEVIARLIHRRSARASGPFVAINCAALAESVLESELFGHERGAFTGATELRRGRFELAHGGTLFLDEIAEISVDLQAKLLRVLQEREFERVGGARSIRVDVRVIAATNRDLQQAIRNGRFRDDLYYRLNVFPIHIPPLRERPEDVLPLAEFLTQRIAVRMSQTPKALSAKAAEALRSHSWPGNVRELKNALERALIVSSSPKLLPTDLPLASLSSGSGDTPGPETMAEIEKRAILEALDRYRGDRRLTAEHLGISLRTLQYRLKSYGLTTRD